MTMVLERLARLFVAPAEASVGAPPRGVAAARDVAVAPAVVVLSGPDDAAAAGAAVALALTRERRASVALLCVWTGANRPRAATVRAPATAAARRLAAALEGRGQPAAASGRLVTVGLPADEGAAVAAAERAGAVAAALPVVVAIGAPRGPAFDALLRVQDTVVVALRPESTQLLGHLALEGVAPLAAPATVWEIPPGPAARALVLAGVAAPPSARALAREITGSRA